MKKILLSITFTIVLTLMLSFIFINFGGNNCNEEKCDCFCCNSFNLRGYESCGTFGFVLGIITSVGILVFYFKKQS